MPIHRCCAGIAALYRMSLADEGDARSEAQGYPKRPRLDMHSQWQRDELLLASFYPLDRPSTL